MTLPRQRLSMVDHDYWLGDHPQPDSGQAVDGMRHVGFGGASSTISLSLLQK